MDLKRTGTGSSFDSSSVSRSWNGEALARSGRICSRHSSEDPRNSGVSLFKFGSRLGSFKDGDCSTLIVEISSRVCSRRGSSNSGNPEFKQSAEDSSDR